jgi:hypothetical protein
MFHIPRDVGAQLKTSVEDLLDLTDLL